jgi:hypothetical protein
MVKRDIRTFFEDGMNLLQFLEKLGEIYPHLALTTKENPVLEKINGQISDAISRIVRTLLEAPLVIDKVPDELLVHIFLDGEGARCKKLEQAKFVVTFPASATSLMKIFDLAYKKEKILSETAQVISMDQAQLMSSASKPKESKQ